MPVGHAFATGALRRPRWRLVFAAVATAVAMVGLPTTAASAAPVLKPGFNIGTFADLTSVMGGANLTNFAYLPGGKVLAVGKTGFIAVGPPPGTAGAYVRLTVNGTPASPLPV